MEEVLEKVGLSKNESKVYITLLKLGSSSAGIIAEKSRVYRTNVYEALNRLVEKSLVSYVFKGHQKFFQAEKPEKILDILREKEDSFKKILVHLSAQHSLPKNKDKVSIFEGLNGLKTITDDILKEKEQANSFNEVLTFGIPNDVSFKMRTFINSYHNKRVKLKLVQKHIYDENAKMRIEHLNKMPYTEAAYLTNHANSPATTTIYGNKVAFFIWSDPVLSILIESERMAETYRNYFNLLYSIALKKADK